MKYDVIFVMPSPIPRKSQNPRTQFDKGQEFKINMNTWLYIPNGIGFV